MPRQVNASTTDGEAHLAVLQYVPAELRWPSASLRVTWRAGYVGELHPDAEITSTLTVRAENLAEAPRNPPRTSVRRAVVWVRIPAWAERVRIHRFGPRVITVEGADGGSTPRGGGGRLIPLVIDTALIDETHPPKEPLGGISLKFGASVR